MIKPSLVDDVTVFLNRISALADSEHTDDFVDLFDLSGCSVMPVQRLEILDSAEGIRDWHQSIFKVLEILQMNVDLLHCFCVDSMILVQACFHCQFCFVDVPDQLEATNIRMSLIISKKDKQLKIRQMHCSLPGGLLREGVTTEFVDPFADE